MVLLTKFRDDSSKIVDFLLLVNFLDSPVFMNQSLESSNIQKKISSQNVGCVLVYAIMVGYSNLSSFVKKKPYLLFWTISSLPISLLF